MRRALNQLSGISIGLFIAAMTAYLFNMFQTSETLFIIGLFVIAVELLVILLARLDHRSTISNNKDNDG